MIKGKDVTVILEGSVAPNWESLERTECSNVQIRDILGEGLKEVSERMVGVGGG